MPGLPRLRRPAPALIPPPERQAIQLRAAPPRSRTAPDPPSIRAEAGGKVSGKAGAKPRAEGGDPVGGGPGFRRGAHRHPSGADLTFAVRLLSRFRSSSAFAA